MDISSVMLLRGLGYVHVWETYIRASSGSCGLQIYRSKWIGVQSLRVSISGSGCSEDKATVPPILLGMKKERGKKKASVKAKLEGKCSQNR